MNIPVFTFFKWVEETGLLASEAYLLLDQLFQALQNGLSDNGWTLPQITAAQLTDIAPRMPNGTMWYETDNHEMILKVAGVLRKVTTTAYP